MVDTVLVELQTAAARRELQLSAPHSAEACQLHRLHASLCSGAKTWMYARGQHSACEQVGASHPVT